jgi:regulator of replication initiation timing
MKKQTSKHVPSREQLYWLIHVLMEENEKLTCENQKLHQQINQRPLKAAPEIVLRALAIYGD